MDDVAPPSATPEPADGQDEFGQFRKSFRVPVGDRQALSVRVGEELFDAFDLVEGGVGIFHARRAAFSVGQALENLALVFRGEPLPVQGRVVHVFRDDQGQIRYGIEFLDMDEDIREQVRELVRITRTEYLDHLDDETPDR